MKVTLFLPTLNEFDGMRQIMPRIRKEWCDQIIVADGNSTDGTVEFARAQGCEVIIQKRKGIRHAYLESFPQIRGDIVITMSPDGNCIPEVIPSLIEKMSEGYDMVVVSRYATGAKSEDDDTLTAFGNWMFTKLINVCHGGHYTDSMGIYRAWKREIFTKLDLDKEESYATEKLFGTVMGIEPLISIRCAKARLKVAEIPADEPRRVGGERKLQVLRWGAAYLVQVFREIYYWRPSRPDKAP